MADSAGIILSIIDVESIVAYAGRIEHFLEHNRTFLEHNRTFLEHNRTFLEHYGKNS